MATVSYSNGYLYVNWTSFSVSGNAARNYNVELFKGSESGLPEDFYYGMSVNTRSHTFSNIQQGTYYIVKVYAQMQTGANKVERAYITTPRPSIPPPNTPSYLSASAGNGYINFSWPYAAGSDYYCLEVFNTYGSIVWSNYRLTSTSVTCYVPNGVTYYGKVYAVNVGGNSGAAYSSNVTPMGNPPSTPSGFTLTGKGNGYLSFSWYSVYNASRYCLEIFHTATNQIVWSNYNLSYTSTTCYGLNTGVSYYAKLYAQNNDGNSSATYLYNLMPTYNLPSTPSNFTVTGRGNGYISFSWYTSSYADYYCLEVYHTATNQMVWSSYSLTSTSVTVNGLNTGVSYYAKLYARNGDGNSNAVFIYNIVAVVDIPPQPTNLYARESDTVAGQVNVSWSALSTATSYYVTVRENNINGTIVHSGSVSTNYFSINLNQYRTYYITCAGMNAGGTGNYTGISFTTTDRTPPVISSISGDGQGKMYLSYTASDSGIGMRPTSTYYTEISNANGTTYGQGQYSTATYRSFITDANGNEFEHNAYYYMRVIAFDAAANSSNRDVRIQYKRARPVSWTWHTPKKAGETVNLTAGEWNSFCLRINQFRQYKGLDNYNFTTVSTGNLITAVVINQAINALSNITNAPASVTAGSPITAAMFNTMSTNLNNIT